MASTALAFGIALLLLGVIGYVATGADSPTALIPAAFGVLLALLGIWARNPAKRKTAMHLAAGVGLLGFLGAARGLAGLLALLSGEEVGRPAAVVSQSMMAGLCLIFVALCVRSFVTARRNRGLESA